MKTEKRTKDPRDDEDGKGFACLTSDSHINGWPHLPSVGLVSRSRLGSSDDDCAGTIVQALQALKSKQRAKE